MLASRRRGSGPKSARKGFTLIELLVVISIIGVLAALILPGIQSARKAARRTQCLNNVRNISTAMQNFISRSNSGALPASGYWNVDISKGSSTTNYDVGDFSDTNAWNWNTTNVGANVTSRGNQLPAGSATTKPLLYSWALQLLPYMDRADIYDAWDFSENQGSGTTNGSGGSYLDTSTKSNPDNGSTNDRGNWQLSQTNIAVYNCPEDITVVPGQGNLSYVVNGGFAYHWKINNATSYGATGDQWSPGATPTLTEKNLQRMGLMFLDTTASGTPVSFRRTIDSIRDGTTTTVLLSENVNAGNANDGSKEWINGWANPHPNNTSFFVNGQGACNIGAATTVAYDYSQANNKGSKAVGSSLVTALSDITSLTANQGGINGDNTGLQEGSFPYPNSLHTGGVHVAMCDGSARFITDTINGAVWARLVTPQGGSIAAPAAGSGFTQGQLLFESKDGIGGFRQLPVQEDQY